MKKKEVRSIRFFCKKCGKEMWEDMILDKNNETIGHLYHVLECSDCTLLLGSFKKLKQNLLTR